jgi:dTDP-4-amino-4,6-dideoxygalactose transaminase
MIPHNLVTFSSKDQFRLAEVARSEQYSMGYVTKNFEELARKFYSKNCSIAVSSGSMALRLALIAAGTTTTTKVIVPAYCCSAIPNSVSSLGASVIPCDIDFNTGNICTEHALSLSKQHNAKLIIVVNSFGAGIDITPLKERGLIVIEDCSHGFNLNTEKRPETNGDFIVQSLYATKLFGAAELGVLLFDNQKISDDLQQYRSGYTPSTNGFALNCKPDEFSCSLGAGKFENGSEIIQTRTEIAERYLSSSVIKSKTLNVVDDRVWYRFVIKSNHANLLIEKVRPTAELVKPVSPWLINLHGFPNATRAYQEYVSIPIYPDLKLKDQDIIISLLETILEA